MILQKLGPFYSQNITKALKTSARLIVSRTISLKAEDEEIIVEKLQGEKDGITVFSLNRPEAKNALSQSLVQTLLRELDSLRSDAKTRVLVLRSNVPGIFCAGADLKERAKMTPDQVGPFVKGLRQLMRNLETVPIPVICALDGAALGGGLEMALSCDLRIAADNIKLGLVETKLAIIPGAGGTQRLPRIISPAIAKELIFTARILTGIEAKELGIVNHSVSQNDLKTAAYERALSLASEILPNGPVALKMAKLAINEGLQLPLPEAFKVEEECYEGVINTQDRLEGLKAFGEKRKPVYTGK